MFNKLRKKLLPDKVPENLDVSPTEYSFFIVANRVSVAAFIVHTLFLGLFLWLGISELVWFNLLSGLLYLATYFLNRNGYYNPVLFLIVSEIVLHGVLAVYYLGLETGFQYYIIAIIPVIFFSALQSAWLKFAGTGLIAALYAALNIYSQRFAPVYSLSETTLFNLKYLNIVLVFSVIGIPAYYYNSAVIETRRRLKKLNKRLKKLALHDSLINLLNRRAMNKKIANKVREKEESNFVLIIADIDDFKIVNDQYGHNYGDFVLKEIAKLMQQVLQGNGMVSRWGGEEFLIFLPHTRLNQGLATADRLKDKIANHTFNYNDQKIHITVTMGVSEYHPEIDLEECIREADQALYRGKQTGKNKVAAY